MNEKKKSDSNGDTVRIISSDRTLDDIFEQGKEILTKISFLELRTARINIGEPVAEFPIHLPLETIEDVEACEEYLQNPQNFQAMLDYTRYQLKSVGRSQFAKKAMRTLFAPSIYELYGWSDVHNRITMRKSAKNLVLFNDFLLRKFSLFLE